MESKPSREHLIIKIVEKKKEKTIKKKLGNSAGSDQIIYIIQFSFKRIVHKNRREMQKKNLLNYEKSKHYLIGLNNASKSLPYSIISFS